MVRRLKLLTVADFFRRRYGRHAEILSSLSLVPIYIAWVSGMLVAFGARRKEVWFWVDEAGKRLCVAGRYQYARDTLDPDTRAAMESLSGSDTDEDKQ